MEKAYFSLTNTSLTSLHTYYKNEVINRNRSEILKFMNTHQQYEKLVEESENIQKLWVARPARWTEAQFNVSYVFSNLKEEYMSLVNNSNPPKNLSPASSNMNDSDASRYGRNAR